MNGPEEAAEIPKTLVEELLEQSRCTQDQLRLVHEEQQGREEATENLHIPPEMASNPKTFEDLLEQSRRTHEELQEQRRNQRRTDEQFRRTHEELQEKQRRNQEQLRRFLEEQQRREEDDWLLIDD